MNDNVCNTRRVVRAKRMLTQYGYKDFFSAMNGLAFYKQRVKELEKHKDQFPEPYYTMVCNILANGKIKP